MTMWTLHFSLDEMTRSRHRRRRLYQPATGAGAWVHVGFRWNSPMRGQVLTITQRGTRSGLVYK